MIQNIDRDIMSIIFKELSLLGVIEFDMKLIDQK